MTTEKQSVLERILVPVIVSAIMSGLTGYLGASKAIAVLESRVDAVESTQKDIKKQQDGDGRALASIEAKLDLLLIKQAK